MRLKPKLRVEIEIHVFDAEITRNPRAINDQRHRHLIEFLKPRRAFENVPLFRSHKPVKRFSKRSLRPSKNSVKASIFYVVRLKLSARWRLGGKAAEDCRSPKPVGSSWQPIISIASWTAAVLCRFSFAYQSLPDGFNRTLFFGCAQNCREMMPSNVAKPLPCAARRVGQLMFCSDSGLTRTAAFRAFPGYPCPPNISPPSSFR